MKQNIISEANRLANKEPVTVTKSTCPRSAGTIHDYYSEGDYWWPDPAHPGGLYIQKDGMSNPDNCQAHRLAYSQFNLEGMTLLSWILSMSTNHSMSFQLPDGRSIQKGVAFLAPYIQDDPNLTDKKFPGNPTKSYRSLHPFRVVGEVTEWQGHSPEQLRTMKDRLAQLDQQGIEAIED